MNSRSIGLTAFFLMLTVPAHAGPRDDALQAVAKCAAIADNAARLACYDAAAPGVKDALSAPPAAVTETAPATQQAATPPTKEEQESWFGRNIGDLFGTSPAQQTTPQAFGTDKLPETQATPQHPVELDSITQTLTDYAFNPFGKVVVFLANGQVWRQVQGDTERLYLKKNPADNTVTISRGMLGSYNMTANDSDRMVKVTRVK